MSLGVNNSYSLDNFKAGFRIQVRKMSDEVMEFDMIGCDPSVANALRRILIAEVPTVAAEHVFFINNTSIIQVAPAPLVARPKHAATPQSVAAQCHTPCMQVAPLPIGFGCLECISFFRRLLFSEINRRATHFIGVDGVCCLALAYERQTP